MIAFPVSAYEDDPYVALISQAAQVVTSHSKSQPQLSLTLLPSTPEQPFLLPRLLPWPCFCSYPHTNTRDILSTQQP